MTDRKISNFELGTLNFFLTRALLIGFTFSALLNSVKQDSWIIPIISILPGIIVILVINYITNYKTNLNIGEKIINLFNKKIGTLIIIPTIMLIYIISTLNYLHLNNFIQSQFLNRTPLISTSLMFIVVIYYILNKGINTITRTSNILFYFGFILLILSFIGLLPAIKADNLKPFFTSNPLNCLNGLYKFYSFNILPMFLITIIPKQKIVNPKIKKVLIISYVISAISIFLIIFQTIGTFGYELSSLYEYPEFFALKHVILIELASRVESILVIQLILDIFVFTLFALYFIASSIKVVIKSKKNNITNFFICALMVIATIIISKYNMYIDNLALDILPIITSIFFTILIVIISIKIKMSK